MASIDVSSRVRPGYVVVALRGELDLSDAAGLARGLAGAVAPGSRVIVDLAELAFIDSCAVGVLASAWKQARRAGGDLLVAAPQGVVLRVLSLTGLIDVLPVFASVEKAASSDGRVAVPAVSNRELAGGEVN